MSVMTVKRRKAPVEGQRRAGIWGEKDRLIYCEDRKYGYMDLDGKVLIKARF